MDAKAADPSSDSAGEIGVSSETAERDGIDGLAASDERDDSDEEAGSEDGAATEDAAVAAPVPPRAPAVPIKLLILVTVVNIALVLGLFALRPPQRTERVTQVPTMPAPVAQLAAQVQRGEHGAAYDLVLTDDDLSATAGYFLAQSADVPFSQVHVTVSDGRVEAAAVTTGTAVSVPVRITANVVAKDGAPVVQVVDVGIGGMPLPAFAHEQVLREANRAVDLSRYSLPVTVDTITLKPGVLEARGTVK